MFTVKGCACCLRAEFYKQGVNYPPPSPPLPPPLSPPSPLPPPLPHPQQVIANGAKGATGAHRAGRGK